MRPNLGICIAGDLTYRYSEALLTTISGRGMDRGKIHDHLGGNPGMNRKSLYIPMEQHLKRNTSKGRVDSDPSLRYKSFESQTHDESSRQRQASVNFSMMMYISRKYLFLFEPNKAQLKSSFRYKHIFRILLHIRTRFSPRNPVLAELRDSRPQRPIVQRKVVDRPEAQDVGAGESTRDAVQQRPARLAEVAVHLIARGNAVLALVLGQVVLATHVLERVVFLADNVD